VLVINDKGELPKWIIGLTNQCKLISYMENLKVRLSTDKNDIESVLKVVSSFGADRIPLLKIRKYLENELSSLGKNHLLILLENSSNTLGVVQLIVEESTGHIHALQVDKAFHRKGLGFRLIQDLEKHAKRIGINRLTLAVDSDNNKALSLYKKLGYEIFDEIQKEKSIIIYYFGKEI
jgi:ribosomal protein S18 acetylase RimI-like enzyme